MTKRTLIVTASVSLLFAILVIGCATTGNAEKATVNFNGTWVNEKILPQKEVDTPDGWKQYNHVSDTSPIYAGTSKLTRQWTDSEGNVWVKSLNTFTIPDEYKGQIFTVLTKYSKNGAVMESTWQMPSSDEEMKNPVYPSKIDSQDPHYSIYYREEK